MAHLLTDEAPQLLPALREILRRHGVMRAAFFGSLARGQETEQNDVDLLVEFAPGRSLLDQAALKLDLVTLFGREVEVVTYQSLDSRIREQALRDQVAIL